MPFAAIIRHDQHTPARPIRISFDGVTMEKGLQDIAAQRGSILDSSTLTEMFENLLLEPVRLADILVDGSRQNMDSRWAKRPLRIASSTGNDPIACNEKTNTPIMCARLRSAWSKALWDGGGNVALSVPTFSSYDQNTFRTLIVSSQLEFAGGFPPMPFLRKGSARILFDFAGRPIQLAWRWHCSWHQWLCISPSCTKLATYLEVHLESNEQQGIAPRHFASSRMDLPTIMGSLMTRFLNATLIHLLRTLSHSSTSTPDSDHLWSETYGWNEVPAHMLASIARSCGVGTVPSSRHASRRWHRPS